MNSIFPHAFGIFDPEIISHGDQVLADFVTGGHLFRLFYFTLSE